MAVDVGSAKGYLDLDISGFLSGLKTAQSEADSASKNIATKIGNNISGVGKTLSSAGKTLTKNVTLPLVGIGAVGIKVASDFEKGMSQVQAISGATGNELEALKQTAVDLGASTAFSASEVAEAMTEMAKAGWDSQQIIDGMSGVLDAAAASGEGLASVSTIVADTITGFGLAAADSAKVADLLTQAANSGTIGITDLGESFKYIAPVAGSMGLSVEDVTTALSAMSMAGIKGSQAGTSLRTMLTRMVKPTDDVTAAMEELGINLVNSDGTFKSLDDIVAIMRNSFSGLTDEQKTYYATVLAGQEGMSGMLSLLNLTEKEYNEIASSMENSGGVAKETAEVMQNNLQSKVEQLLGSLESLAIKLSEHVIPPLQNFVKWLTNLVDKFTELDPKTQKAILKFGAIAAAIGPALFIIGKLTSGVGGLITAFGKTPGVIAKFASGISSLTSKLTGVPVATSAASAGAMTMKTSFKALGSSLGSLASAAGPILAVVAVIAILIAAFVSLWKNNEEFREKITAIWNQVKEAFERLTSGIVERLNKLGFNFKSITEVIKAIWDAFCNFLAPAFEYTFSMIADTFDFIIDTILNTLDFFISIFKGDWEGAWNAVKSQFENVWNTIGDFFENICNRIIGVARTVLSWFGIEWNADVQSVTNWFKEAWQSVVDFFTNLVQMLWGKVKPLFEEIASAFQMAWDVIKLIWSYVQPYFAMIWEGIKLIFKPVVEWFKLIFGIAWESIKAIWSVVVSWFKLLWENIKAIFKPVVEWFKGIFRIAWESIKAIWNTAIAFFTMIWAGIKAVFAVVKGILSGDFTDAWNAIKNVWDKAKNYFSTIWNGIKNVFGAVGSFFKNTFSAAWEAIKKIFSNFGTFFSGLWNTIKNTFTAIGTKIGNAIGGAVKAGINGVIGMIENMINGFIGMINGAINLINLIPGVEIGKINKLYIPRLAKGAVLPPNNPFLAVVGDQKQGTNVEAPLATIQEAVANVIKSFAYDIIVLQKIAIDILKDCYNELGYITHNGFTKSHNINDKRDDFNKDNNSGGDTFNFYSPKPIDEIEAAKQMKKTKRELAEGY